MTNLFRRLANALVGLETETPNAFRMKPWDEPGIIVNEDYDPKPKPLPKFRKQRIHLSVS